MSNKDFRLDIAGYTDILKEMDICRKYGQDYRLEKGKWMEYVNYIHPSKIELRVADIIEETSKVKTLRLVSTTDSLPPFLAGQYINLFANIDGVRTSRPYSISSSPAQTAYYDITVGRIREGFVSDYLLDKVKVGDILESSSPTGNFYYNPLFHGEDLVFLAGGTGITPFMSMIREVIDKGLARSIQLFYGSNSVEDAIFHEELLEKAKKFNNLKYNLVISDLSSNYAGLKGLIDADLIKENVADINTKTFYICGPVAMYEFCLPELDKLSIPRKRIRREVYNFAGDIVNAPAWPNDVTANSEFTVAVIGGRVKTQTIKAKATEPLVVAMERNGIQVPSSCRSGECSLCRVKVLRGNVFELSGHVRKSDRDNGYVHACSAYPVSDLEIIL
ncbi:Phenol hydroxylase reductase [Syntrophomonas zehnderi OL-4]|uniref:Phenol hydroxylase reductase n=1 Tax=Syntrophomonas zehnderi OL-4 TaxID=690567 RepID=A0A0E4G9G0_9FIRM|nr:2Fe-2S iron-sulfur cluster-binding protein [Syntrophomonas zehnderi]CFX14270.1 Phenol hydroxylase reductase [Syntrophomonas zehnderi OL-4]